MSLPIPVEYASQRKIRERNKLYYRFNHWPIWIFVFFIAPGPLTVDLFDRGFDWRMAIWLGGVLVGTGIAGLRGRLPGVEPKPYIIRFTEDRPNPPYRRICYTFAWSEAVAFAVLNIAGLVVAIASGHWYLKQIYRYELIGPPHFGLTNLHKSRSPNPDGWQGWDEYAPFYDWENAQTLGRRDVPFWRRLALTARGPVLELGCGTGRVSKPLVKAGVDLVGIDRSAEMLRRIPLGRVPLRRIPNPECRIAVVRGDIRSLPFADRTFAMVIAPYGVLQSLVREADLAATLDSVGRAIDRGGTFGIDLVPDVPKWREYENRVQLRGRAGGRHLTLIESVRQDRRRRLTTFAQRYLERRKGATTEHRFELTFRTLTVPQMTARLERAGFVVERILGDYRGQPWDARADVWIILATRRR